MPEVTVVPPGGGEVVGDSPERRVEILCDEDALHATWSRFGPGREGADLHVHRRHTDLFYVLEGELTVRLGPEGRERVVPAGAAVQVPPLVVHGFRNGSDRELRYLNLHAPGQGFADYMRAIRDGRTLVYDQEPPPDDGGRPVSGVRIEPDATTISVGAGRLRAYYVLEGELVLPAGDGEVRAGPGTWVHGDALAVPGGARVLEVRAG